MQEISTSTLHYYVWWNDPVIYDDQLKTAVYYNAEDAERKSINYYAVEEHADEITDENEIKEFFSETLMQQYNNSSLLKDCRDYFDSIKKKGSSDLTKTLIA
jgi:cytidylate kinase